MTPKFYVWKRNDGYIGATAYMPTNFYGGGPYDKNIPWVANITSFIELGEFLNWGDAVTFMAESRLSAA